MDQKTPRNEEIKYYKAVDSKGLSFFPVDAKKRVNWVALINGRYTLGNEEGWHKAVERLRKGQTAACTEHMIHGYTDINLAIDFGQRYAEDRADKRFRIIEFKGAPVAEMTSEMVLEKVELGEHPWEDADKERFTDVAKYGFRSVFVLREVPEAEWPEQPVQ